MPWSMVAAFDSIGEAESVRSALEAAGIDAELVDESTVGVNWLYSNAVGGVKLYVPDEQVEDSEELMATAAESVAGDGEVPAPELEPEVAALTCPACGSTEISRTPRLRIFFFFAIVFAGLGVAVNRTELAAAGIAAVALATALSPSHRCNACGERFTAQAGEDRRALYAPPPSARDTADELCPRCGSTEFHHIEYRRLKAIPLLFELAALPVVTIWWALPKRRCDVCGYKT